MPTQRQHHGFDDMTLIIQKNEKNNVANSSIKNQLEQNNGILFNSILPCFFFFLSHIEFFLISSRKIIVQNQNKTAWRIIFHTIEW